MSLTLATPRSLCAVLPLALACGLISCGDSPPPGVALGETSAALFANDHTIYDYFVGKGLTSFQAAGIVGNLDQESGGSPTAMQNPGPGRGIAQWSVGGRWDTDGNDNATAFANAKGQSVWSLQLQLDFIWYELTTFPGYGLAALQATSNVTDATVVFQDKFEGCGTCDQTQRVGYANNVLAAYGAAPPYAAKFVSQSFPLASMTLPMVEGQVIPSFIELKNVGTKTWDANTRLGTTQARDRVSVFADGTWASGSRPAAVVGTVPPGGSYKFSFDLAAPGAPGLHDEFFGVVQEGVAWFGDPGQGGPPDNDLEVKIEVVPPRYRGVFKGQSFPLSPAALTVHQGEVAKGFIELTNTGSQTWKAGSTKLATIPRDAPSAFADPSWLSPTRVSTVPADVAPGAVGHFEVALDASSVGDTKVPFGLVEEGVAWFSDPGEGGPADGLLEVHLVVVAKAAPPDAGVPPPVDAGADGSASSDGGGLDAGKADAGDGGKSDGGKADAGGHLDGGNPGGEEGGVDAGNGGNGDGGGLNYGAGEGAAPTSDSSGCSVRGTPGAMPTWVAALVGLAVAGRRRRKSPRPSRR